MRLGVTRRCFSFAKVHYANARSPFPVYLTKMLLLFSLPTQMQDPNARMQGLVPLHFLNPWRRIVPCTWWYNAALDDANSDIQNVMGQTSSFRSSQITNGRL